MYNGFEQALSMKRALYKFGIIIIINGVSSGDLAVKHLALGANCHRFDLSKRSKLFQRLILGSQHRGWLTTLNGAVVYTEL